jgi:hypothetical protein
LLCLAFGLLGFQTARARRMVAQYPWINEPDGPLRWRRKPR